MASIEGFPKFFIAKAYAGDEVFNGLTEIPPEIFHHFLKRRGFVDKARALGKEYAAEKARKPGGALAAGAPEVLRIKSRRIWNQPKVLGMGLKTVQNQPQGLRKTSTKSPRNRGGFEGLRMCPFAAEVKCLIEGNA